MPTTITRVLLSCVVIGVIACVCLCVLSASGVIVLRSFPELIFSINATPTVVSTSTPRVEASPPAATDLANTDTFISPEIAGQMDQIQQEVIDLRGLKLNQPVARALLTPEQLREHVINDFLKDYTTEEAQKDTIVLAAFGLLDDNFDLRNLYIELLSEQVAGFYDNEMKEMYVVQGEGFFGPQRLTYAHEFTHVLQDQTYDIKDGLKYSDEICKQVEESERCAAIQALIEGDASLAEMNWFSSYATPQDLVQILEFSVTSNSPVFDNAPDFLKQDLLFPYQQGQAFVQHLYQDGGWRAVDDAYRNLPLSTEQILHPERYPDNKPVSVTLPDLSTILGNGWDELDRGVLGEWYTTLVLAHGVDANTRLSDSQTQTAAEGWGGDAYVVYYNEQSRATVMVLTTQWESPDDSTEFINAFREYATARFDQPAEEQDTSLVWQSGAAYVMFNHLGQQTTWILAPDATTAQSVWDTLQP